MARPITDGGLLRGQDLVKRLGGRMVLEGVSLEIDAGEVVGLLGPNGAGKTTLFRLLMGLLDPDAGVVTFHGRPITHLPPHRRARLGLGYLAQHTSVFQAMTVVDNLRAVLELKGRTATVEPLLRDFDLQRVSQQRAGLLSGGERRRLELARLEAASPDVVLLDEPFKGLDVASLELVRGMVHRWAEAGCGVMITDHALEQTLALCQRAYFLRDGRVVQSGTGPQVGGVMGRSTEQVADSQPGSTTMHRGTRGPDGCDDGRTQWHSN